MFTSVIMIGFVFWLTFFTGLNAWNQRPSGTYFYLSGIGVLLIAVAVIALAVGILNSKADLNEIWPTALILLAIAGPLLLCGITADKAFGAKPREPELPTP